MTGVLEYIEKKCVGEIGCMQILMSEKCKVPSNKWMAANIL